MYNAIACRMGGVRTSTSIRPGSVPWRNTMMDDQFTISSGRHPEDICWSIKLVLIGVGYCISDLWPVQIRIASTTVALHRSFVARSVLLLLDSNSSSFSIEEGYRMEIIALLPLYNYTHCTAAMNEWYSTDCSAVVWYSVRKDQIVWDI